MLPDNIRRLLSLFIPATTALILFGIIPGIFKIDFSTNIVDTGFTIGMLFGVLNLFLWWLAYKHYIP